MGNLSVGQVVLASFPFSDLSSSKLRPCIIAGIAEFDDVVVCQITSRPYNSKRSISLTPTTDFMDGTIIRQSYIRPDKLATLDTRTIKQVVGSVTDNKLAELRQALKTFFEIT